MNFCVATRLPRKYVPAATWIFNIGTLFANELADGYKFTKIAAYFSPLDGAAAQEESSAHNLGAWLDSYGGIMSRWEILFNLTVLRLISFNMDYYFSLTRRGGSPIEVCGHPSITAGLLLILIRRNNSTLQISPNETELQHLRMSKNTTSATMLPMLFTPLFTSRVQS